MKCILLHRHFCHSEELLREWIESSGILLYSSVSTGEYLPMFGRNVAIILRLNINEIGGIIVPPNIGDSSPIGTAGIISHTIAIRYLGLVLDSKRLFTKHLHTVTCKATCAFLQLFPLLSRYSTLTLHNKLTIYKLPIRPILTYAAPVWSNTSPSNYRHLQVLQSKCFRVIGDYPRSTPIPHLHSTLSLEPIHEFIYRLTAKFFNCSTHTQILWFAK